TELRPLDILAEVVPAGGLAPALRVFEVQGLRGFQLAASQPRALAFPASRLFIHCHRFPEEFSIIVTLRVLGGPAKRNEYIFTLMAEESPRVLVGLRYATNKLHFIFWSHERAGSWQTRVTFPNVSLSDNQWHTLVLAVSGQSFSLTVDCSVPKDVVTETPFPASLSVKRASFYLGNRRRRKGAFTVGARRHGAVWGHSRLVVGLGLQRDAEGSGASPSDTKVTLGSRPPCTKQEKAQFWFNASRRGLYLCNGSAWVSMLEVKQRLDYVEEYQNLVTNSETMGVEVFTIPKGTPATQGHRAPHQPPRSLAPHLPTCPISLCPCLSAPLREQQTKMPWLVIFQIFLAVANFEQNDRGQEFSVIYKWSRRKEKFVTYSFCSQCMSVCLSPPGNNHNIDSVIYRWNPRTGLFETNQTIPTSGAYDWEFFTIGPYSFLAVANTFNGTSTKIYSHIYIWLSGSFQLFQSIL
ncbi:TSEAR protein, partial [Columbina picui]|nr:TSEAR protein [Columbina picui]